MRIVGFGDFLIHFSPHENERFFQANAMTTTYTGAEANVCAALAFWGESVQFVTKLPGHMLAQKGRMFLNGLGLKTDHIETGDGRMGLYFLEKGHALRPSAVIYDRADTVFTKSTFLDYDWNAILKDTKAFYLSGITPSLSDSLLDCCEKAMQKAREKNIPVFYDVNLRPSICTIEKSREIFERLSPYITHLISNEEHLKQLLCYEPAEKEDEPRLLSLAKTAEEKTKIRNIAITVRRTISAHQTSVFAAYCNGQEIVISPQYEIDVVDRVGSGDAFSAGMVYSVMHDFSNSDAVNFAIASCALKHTINDDINYSTVREIRSIMEGKSFDVRR